MNSKNNFDDRDTRKGAPISIKAISLDDVIAEIAERRSEFNQRSHVPLDMIEKMKAVGIFRASTPKCFGGDALPPAEFLRIVERVSEADGSVGWVTAFGSANIYLAALPPTTQALIYANGPDQVYAGGLYPLQPAKETENGWEVSGHWRFASGCKGANWIGVGIGGTSANGRGPTAGKPLTAVFPASEVQIVDNWNVVGMQGTGSHDLKLHQKNIQREWTFVRGSASTIDEPLYYYPSVSYQAQVHAAVNLGLARAALDLVIAMSGSTKTVTGAPRLGDRAYYRSELGKAEAMLRSAQAFFYESAEAVWASLIAGNAVTLQQTNLLRLSATHAAHTGADVVMKAYRLAGTAAIFNDNRLQWIVRDSMVVTQHAFLGEATYDGAGAVFAGIEPTIPYP
ncbi:Flavin-dependent monooxygenase, oxygenase subunit HsaA [Pseudomonas sp. 28 E 9]|jgi:alkylation response protein AidB-like acyl-CoA dehydrogenase|uniref:acyl-CoA dehydrogenase family protein n=1 Tax=Pseudomonas sp. 28 E 9 TaxID=1844098 RepID=UPI000812B3AD|nr:acyl-CoA dehydrogenase family protein [Pseudomonas sp. 28 E 9]CRM11499.1 Flavin-dependent monooxygenase, oxygenase subunit HsaA [Pseudomonas sp. 28 E 9]